MDGDSLATPALLARRIYIDLSRTTTTHSAAKNVFAITPMQREVISELVGAPISIQRTIPELA